MVMAALAVLCMVLVSTACGASVENASSSPPDAVTAKGYAWGERGSIYTGRQSMEELLVESSAVARVRFKSARQTIEEIRLGYDPWLNIDTYHVYYANALEITFEVKEYLKGSGGTEIQAILYDRDNWEATRAEVEALNDELLPLRGTRWDDRDAIVFLRSSSYVVSTVSDADRYWMLAFRVNDEDAYTVASEWARVWLPAANASGARGASAANQQFVIALPSDAQGASGRSVNQGETLGLGELKTLIATLQAEMDAGGTVEYAQCVRDKYHSARYEEWYKESREEKWDWSYNQQFDKSMASGQPAGTTVHADPDVQYLSDDDLATTPSNFEDRMYIGGQDADLFAKGWPFTATAARPLPEGVYRFYWAYVSPKLTLCDGMPELRKTQNEIVVTVTPPPGTLHEAFFDPVTLGAGVGADSSNGVLNPASFTVDGTSTSITGLKWESGSVVLSLSPYSSLSGHKLDFIELDGSVSLSLPASSATEDTTAGTLTWSVSDQPWHNAEMLMLRIFPHN